MQAFAPVCHCIIPATTSDPMDGSSCQGGLPQDKILRTVDFGTVRIAASLWEQYGLGNIFREVAKKNQIPYEKALLAMVTNRLCSPESKLGVWDRWLETVYLPECNELQLHHMYEAMDLFHQHAKQVEREIFFQVANLLNLTVDIIFYDTTTASFAIDYQSAFNFAPLSASPNAPPQKKFNSLFLQSVPHLYLPACYPF
jgi:hypothetical protein